MDHLLEWPDDGPTGTGRGALSGVGAADASGAGVGALSGAGCGAVSYAGAPLQSGIGRTAFSVLELTRQHAFRCRRAAVQTAIRVNRAAVARQLVLARRSASGSDTAPVLATLDVVAIEHIDCTPPVADSWARAAVNVSTTLGRDEDALGRICGDRWRIGRGGIGGSSGDRGHLEVPSSSTAEPHNEGGDGTWATCSSPPKKRRTEPDASPAFHSGVHCSGGPQAGSAARSCARGTDWHEDSGRLERAGPLRDDSDGSDASEDGTGSHPADYFHLSSRTRRAATRRGIWSVVKTVGDGTAVVDALATLLVSNAANVRRTISLIERRARDNKTAREEQASTRTRRESFEELTGGVSLAVVLGSGAPLSVSRQPSGTHPVADFSGSRLSLCTSLPVLGAPAVHRARACHNAAFDAAAAGIGPSSRAWAVLQAGAVVAACEEGFRLRADASLLRELRSALRPPGVGAVAAEASLGGSLLDVVARHLSTGTPISAPIVPPRTDTTVLERDTFSRLLCRVCLRYTCRLHGPPCRERLPTTPGVVPVHLPPDPNVLASLQADARTSGAGHPVVGQEGNSPPAGQGAAVSAQVDVGVSFLSQSAVRRARLAGAIHGAIGVAASACPDCVLDPRRHLRGTAEGDDGWTADQVAFL